MKNRLATDNNFTELKKLFDAECTRVEKANQTIDENEHYPPASFVFAALLSGRLFTEVEKTLRYTRFISERGEVDERKVNASTFYPFPLSND